MLADAAQPTGSPAFLPDASDASDRVWLRMSTSVATAAPQPVLIVDSLSQRRKSPGAPQRRWQSRLGALQARTEEYAQVTTPAKAVASDSHKAESRGS